MNWRTERRRSSASVLLLVETCCLLAMCGLACASGAPLPVNRTALSGAQSPSALQFDRDIRPILAENCFPCHGPDEHKRKAKLRLDRRDDAVKALPNGDYAIVPGDTQRSKLVERIHAPDPDDRMPPVGSGKKLTVQDMDSLVRWINGGATWQPHWSFVPPRRSTLPKVKNQRWPRNAIDHFVLARLEQESLRPTAEAPRDVLLRRLSFDLTGLPWVKRGGHQVKW